MPLSYLNISTFGPLKINVNTTLKYYRQEALKKKLKLMGGAINFFTKKLPNHEIFSSMVPLATKYVLKIL